MSFSFNPSNEYSGLISFRIDWFDLLAIQFTLVAQSTPTLHDSMEGALRPPCPSPSPRVHLNKCPLTQWCHTTTSSSFLLQSERNKVKSVSRVWLFMNTRTIAHQAPPYTEFSRVLEWIVIFFSRGSCWSRDWTQVSCIAGRHFAFWATTRNPTRWS